MKFSYLTFLVLFIFFMISFCGSTNTKTVKNDAKATNSKMVKKVVIATTNQKAASANRLKETAKIKVATKHKENSALYVNALIDPSWKYVGPETIKCYLDFFFYFSFSFS